MKQNLIKAFRVADAAKNIGDYEIANTAFAVIAALAITQKRTGVSFLYEYDHDDLVAALSDPDGAGYYDLPALSMHGETGLGGVGERLYLCIPLPLLTQQYVGMHVTRVHNDANGTCWVPRREHDRRWWRLGHSCERREAARRDLRRRLEEAVGEDLIETARALVLHQPEPETDN